MIFLKNIIAFILDSKNNKLLFFIGVIILILLLLQQCDANNKLKDKLEEEKKEVIRVRNNYNASKSKLEQYVSENGTLKGKIQGYTLQLNELETEYSTLFKKYKKEKNKTPKTIVETDFIIKEVINEVPIYISNNDSATLINISDTILYNKDNFFSYNGDFIIYNFSDTIDKVKGFLEFELGMDLTVFVTKDVKTDEIEINAQTNYPNVKFTNIVGAYMLTNDTKKNRIKNRKSFSLGINFGYATTYSFKYSEIIHGPSIGIGLNYQPKFLQF
jgi:hypothetical protein